MRSLLAFVVGLAGAVLSARAPQSVLPKPTYVLKGHTEVVYPVAFSPDGKTLASGSGDGTLKLWDVITGKETTTLEGHNEGWGVFSVVFSPDGKTLASAGGGPGSKIKLWDVKTGKETASFKGHDGTVLSAAF